MPVLSPKVIHISDPCREERRRVEAFVERTYAEVYGGRIASHYPTLMSVQDDAGRIYAVVGFRSASDGPLFLEQYLDVPIEAAVGRATDRAVARDRVVEVGNLASDGRGATAFLFLALAEHLALSGCEFAAATATRTLRGIFDKAGFTAIELGGADPSRLSTADDWGSYYEADPVVMAGAIAPATLPLRAFVDGAPRGRGMRTRLHYQGRTA